MKDLFSKAPYTRSSCLVGNKKGQMFSLYLVFIVIVMIGIVLGMYHKQQSNIQSMVISPMEVLHQRDALELYEARELDLIKFSLNSASGTFGSQQFIDSFRKYFKGGMNVGDTGKMKFFLQYNVYIGDVPLNLTGDDNWFGGLYPPARTFYDGETLVFERASAHKKIRLGSYEEDKVVFPVDFYFEFDKQYRINYVDGKFDVELA